MSLGCSHRGLDTLSPHHRDPFRAKFPRAVASFALGPRSFEGWQKQINVFFVQLCNDTALLEPQDVRFSTFESQPEKVIAAIYHVPESKRPHQISKCPFIPFWVVQKHVQKAPKKCFCLKSKGSRPQLRPSAMKHGPTSCSCLA